MPNVLEYTMGLHTGGFLNPLKHAEGAVKSATSGMSSAFGKLGAIAGVLGLGFGAFKTIEGFAEGLKHVAETGKELRGISQVTGETISSVVILRKAFDEVGIGAESLQFMLSMMQKSLGGVNDMGVPTGKMFKELGLNIEALKKMNAVQQFEAIGAAISKLPDQASKMAAVRGIFGRGGADMMKMFANPDAIRSATEAIGEQAKIYERSAAVFTRLANTMEALREKVRGFFVGLMEQITPMLQGLADRLNRSFDSIQLGQKLGESLRVAAEAFKEGELGTLLFLSIQVGFEKGLPTLANSFLKAFRGPIAYLQAMLESVFTSGKRYAANAIDQGNINIFQPLQNALAKKGLTNLEFQREIDESKKRIADRNKQAGVDVDRRARELEGQYARPVFKPSTDTFYSNALRSLVGSISAKLSPIGGGAGETTAGSGAGVSPLDPLGKVTRRETEGDRLAKIGGFIGGGQSIMHDYARRTAAGVEKLVQKFDSIGVGKFIPVPHSATLS